MWNINQHISLAPLSAQHIRLFVRLLRLTIFFFLLFRFSLCRAARPFTYSGLAPENHGNKSAGRRRRNEKPIDFYCARFPLPMDEQRRPHTWMVFISPRFECWFEERFVLRDDANCSMNISCVAVSRIEIVLNGFFVCRMFVTWFEAKGLWKGNSESFRINHSPKSWFII